MDSEDDIIDLFLEESVEQINDIEEDLLVLEKMEEEVDLSIVNKIFRAFHTIKGGASFFGLENITNLTHAVENLLDQIRKGHKTPDKQTVQILFLSVDKINEMLAEPPTMEAVDISEILEDVGKILEKDNPPEGKNQQHSADVFEEIDALLEKAEEEIQEKENTDMEESEAPSEIPKRTTEEILTKFEAAKNKSETLKLVDNTKKIKSIKPQSKSENIRVNVHLLEDLMSLAGELVLARNQLKQAGANGDLGLINTASGHVDTVTSQLQEAIMKTRMQPIGSILGKFKRIVRDLNENLKKDVELIIEGETVEMDKTIIESINGPLTHIIRNSMDHGLEPTEEREAVGKTDKAQIMIRALHEAGKVIVEIIDNGRGIDPQKIGNKAVEKGLISEKQFSEMPDRELTNLIFSPGFSTAEEITEVSGRGVGMDVVMTELNKIGGVVELTSSLGVGTKLRISLPLTLAIMPSLLMSVDDSIYALPQVNLIQIVRVPVADISEKVMHAGNSLVIRFMDKMIPVIRARDFLEDEIEPINTGDENFGFNCPLHIIVVASGDIQYGIIVDKTLESPEIVVKPLGSNLKSLSIYAGATILGDGTIAPILDVAGILSEMQLSLQEEKEKVEENEEHTGELHQLLIVNNGHEENFAIPMKNVIRIERVQAQKIKHVGTTRTCEIGGSSVAVFSIDDVTNVNPLEIDGSLAVILFKCFGRNTGIVVKRIVDSVETYLEFDEYTHKQPGILGSTFIKDKLSLLVDLFSLVAKLQPQWLEKHELHLKEKDRSFNILVVDDSKFFLNQLSTFLIEAGYSVIKAENGADGLSLLKDSSNNIQMVLTDIEMPVMDGFELTRNIRQDASLEWIPVIAVTSVAGEEAKATGLEAGIDEYLIKLDREEILLNIRKYRKQPNSELAV